ncbi:MAG: hypothetical protein L0Z55_08210 [Planctomycetes bacterium]|nr:hypothetical protein [Planctomycetota bacterium]
MVRLMLMFADSAPTPGKPGNQLISFGGIAAMYLICLWLIAKPRSVAAFIVRDPDATVARSKIESHEFQCFLFFAIGLWIVLLRLPHLPPAVSAISALFEFFGAKETNPTTIRAIAVHFFGSLAYYGSAMVIGLFLIVAPHLLVKFWTKLQRATSITGERVAISCVGLWFLADCVPQLIQFAYLEFGVPVVVFGRCGVDVEGERYSFIDYAAPASVFVVALYFFLLPAGMEGLWRRVRRHHYALRDAETDRRDTPLDASGGETSRSSGLGQP